MKNQQNQGLTALGSKLYTHINYTVVLSGLVRETYQIVLFKDTEEMLSLYQAMDRMKTHYGFDAVRRCACVSFKPNNKDEILKRKK